MRETRERGAFAAEALHSYGVDQRCVEQFDGDLALVPSVAAPGEPHRAHSALTERTLECIRADAAPGQCRRIGREPIAGANGDGSREESLLVEIALDVEQGFKLTRELWRVAPHLRDE